MMAAVAAAGRQPRLVLRRRVSQVARLRHVLEELVRRRPAAVAFAVFATVAAAARFASLRSPPEGDAGQYMYVAGSILDGGTPYVDAVNNKGPVTYLLFVVLRVTSGTSVVPLRLWLVLFAALAAVALAAYVGRFAGRAAGALAGLTFALLAAIRPLEGLDPNTEQFGVAPMMGAWWAATGTGRSRPAVAGALAAAATLMHPAFVVVAPFVLFELWRSAPEDRWRRVAWATGGAAAVAAPLLVWLISAGAVSDMRDQILGQVQSTVGPGALSNNAESGRLSSLRHWTAVPAGVFWIAALAGCAVAAGDRRLRAVALPVAAWIILAWVRVKSQSYEYPKHYYPAVPGMAAGLALGVAALWSGSWRRRAALAGMVLVVPVWAVVVSEQWSASALPHHARGLFPLTELAYQGADEVRGRTRPGDPVLVNGHWSQVYWLADRRAPTRFFDMFSLQHGENGVAERTADVARRPPVAIIALAADRLDPPIPALLASGEYRAVRFDDEVRFWVRKGSGLRGAAP